jgi:alkanesulfonate monooxygenase SsuD/methylene tetrahydromethanopterin reductase-like flavin-dependent oxidoreductase (luciferase family)
MARIMRKLWSEEGGVNYEGRYYTIENGNIRPKPVQKPGIPLYFGAASEAMMKRVARMADGWCAASGPNIEQFVANIARIRGWAVEGGRNPDELGFVKQHNVSIDPNPELAKQRAQEHFERYYGPRFNIASSTTGTLEQVTQELEGFRKAEGPEITLALESPNLDLSHLEQIARATEGLHKT